MTTRPMAKVWIERATDALEKGDFDSAEIRLIISNHLSPNVNVDKYLKLVRRRRLENSSRVDFSQSRDRKVDAEECIVIAKLAIEKGDFKLARQFLLLAEKGCPSYYSKKLLKKIKNIENYRIKQEAKKKFAIKLVDDAKGHFEVGNCDKAEKLLIKSQSIYSNIQAQSLLKEVQDAIEHERVNTENNPANQRYRFLKKIGLNILNILTCTCLEYCGYIRFDNDPPTRNERRNASSSSSRYFFSAADMPYSRETFGNTRHSSTNHSSPGPGPSRTSRNTSGNSFNRSQNDNTHETRNSTRYNFTSDNIPGSTTHSRGNTNNSGRNTDNTRNNRENSRSNNNDNSHSRTNDERSSTYNSFRPDGTNSDTRNNNSNSTRYSYSFRSGQNTNESSSRSNENRRNAEGFQNTGNSSTRNNHRNSTQSDAPRSNTRNNNNNSTRYSYSFRNGENSNNESTSRSNENNRNNTENCRNNSESSRNNTERSGNNTSSSRCTDNSRSRQRSWSRFFRREKEYSDEQLKEVNRVLASKTDYEKLGLSKGCGKEDVRAAFRKLALVLHPDKNKAPRAGEAFMAINDAKYKLLNILSI